MLTTPEKTAASSCHSRDSGGTGYGAPRRDADGRWVELRQIVMPTAQEDETGKPIFNDGTKRAIEDALDAVFAGASPVAATRFDQPINLKNQITKEEVASPQQTTVCDQQALPSATTIEDQSSLSQVAAALDDAFDQLVASSAVEQTAGTATPAVLPEQSPTPNLVASLPEPPEGAFIERRGNGSISKVRFTNGSTAQYRYNDAGELCAFIYARLAWCTDDGQVWTARDKDNEYRLEGLVSVEPDGTLCIQKKDIVRRIFLDGTRYDLHPDGSGQTSKPAQREASPGDLLVMWRRLATVSLGKRSGPQPVSPVVKSAAPVTEKVTVPMQKPSAASVKPAPPAPYPLPSPALITPSMSIYVAQETNSKEEQTTTVRGHLTVRPQRLRGKDDYVKPADSGLAAQIRASFSVWIAQASLALIGRFFGDADARLLPHLDLLASSAYEMRDLGEAERLHTRALELREHFHGRSHEACAFNLQGLARIQYEQGNYPEAAKLYQEAINLHDKNVRKLSFFNNTGLMNQRVREDAITSLLHACNDLAQMLAEQGKYAEGEAQFRRALDVWNALPVATSDDLCAVMHTILRNYKDLLLRANKHVEAQELDVQTHVLMSSETAPAR